MSNRIEIEENALNAISGGSIDFHPANPTAKYGTIGINNSFNYSYENYDDVVRVFNEVYYSKNWTSIAERDQTIFNAMINAGVVKPL